MRGIVLALLMSLLSPNRISGFGVKLANSNRRNRFGLAIIPIISGLLFTGSLTMSSMVASEETVVVDPDYPGTAVRRMLNIRERVKSLSTDQLNGDWEEVRKSILWAGGLKDLPTARPGAGYTGHSFNDYNHVDLTAMNDDVSGNENKGQVAGIAYSNHLGAGIRIASLPELGPGGSWSTCMIGCANDPPTDVAHIQFRSRIAFKLVWTPPAFESFVLVDDDGALLAQGTPTGQLPHISERRQNYNIVSGSKYAVEADRSAAAKLSDQSCQPGIAGSGSCDGSA